MVDSSASSKPAMRTSLVLGPLIRDGYLTESVAVPIRERSDSVFVVRIPVSIIHPGFARQVAGVDVLQV